MSFLPTECCGEKGSCHHVPLDDPDGIDNHRNLGSRQRRDQIIQAFAAVINSAARDNGRVVPMSARMRLPLLGKSAIALRTAMLIEIEDVVSNVPTAIKIAPGGDNLV